jgi:predicted DNA-binding protein with PD1-like motif
VKHRIVSAAPGYRKVVAVFDVDDDVIPLLENLCDAEQIVSGLLSGIGGFRSATVAYYGMDAKRYEPIAVHEQVEVVSLLGNVTRYAGKPKIHAHCIVAHRDGHTTAGHLQNGVVRPTLELFIEAIDTPIVRTDRPDIGIPLIEL